LIVSVIIGSRTRLNGSSLTETHQPLKPNQLVSTNN